MRTFFQCSRSGVKKGFTLIELLVVIAIMVVVTSLILFRQEKFDSSTLLRSLAYSVALSMRQAQVYGIAVRQNQSGTFSASYGIYFNSGSSDTYILFADLNGNGQYNPSPPPGERVTSFSLNKGYSIKDICAAAATGNVYCSRGDGAGGQLISELTVYFIRPNTDANFWTDTAGAGPYSYALIVLQGPAGDTRTVKVTTTGQMTVCPVNASITAC